MKFNDAADAYIDEQILHSAEKTCRTDRERSQALRRSFGDVALRRITAEQILEYQKARVANGISGRTINLEVGLLRRILKKHKQWSRLADDVRMLPETPKEPRVLSPEEKETLLAVARSRPEWRVTYCAAVLALNTTMRKCELLGLHWTKVDLFEGTLTVRRKSTKTDAGGRVLPLNRNAVKALAELRDRAQAIGPVDDSHYVFPSCENGHIRPEKPMKSWRSAWRTLTKRAGLVGFRFHDLRHHAITELAEVGLSDQTIMSSAGHVSREMLDHYSHIRLDAKRKALDALAGPVMVDSDDATDGLVTQPH